MTNKDKNEIVTILETITKKYNYSEKVVKCSTDNELFDDTCNYVNLIYELNKLCETLKNINKYREILGKE